MNDDKRCLKGSDRRDVFKRFHKDINGSYYASDLDLVLIAKYPPGIVAYLDYKTPWDTVSFSEVILYNEQSRIAPVYVIESANPQTGPFRISLFSTGDYRPHPPRVELELTTECQNWRELEAWEGRLRNRYQIEKKSV
ncbi:MAG: hypothetical protein V2A73_07895 [Pseudomonadota bacterium]